LTRGIIVAIFEDGLIDLLVPLMNMMKGLREESHGQLLPSMATQTDMTVVPFSRPIYPK
jgi:hypothetical protein